MRNLCIVAGILCFLAAPAPAQQVTRRPAGAPPSLALPVQSEIPDTPQVKIQKLFLHNIEERLGNIEAAELEANARRETAENEVSGLRAENEKLKADNSRLHRELGR